MKKVKNIIFIILGSKFKALEDFTSNSNIPKSVPRSEDEA